MSLHLRGICDAVDDLGRSRWLERVRTELAMSARVRTVRMPRQRIVKLAATKKLRVSCPYGDDTWDESWLSDTQSTLEKPAHGVWGYFAR